MPKKHANIGNGAIKADFQIRIQTQRWQYFTLLYELKKHPNGTYTLYHNSILKLNTMLFLTNLKTCPRIRKQPSNVSDMWDKQHVKFS